MDLQTLERNVMNERESSKWATSALPVLMRKVYVWMTLALVITAMTAYGVAHSPGLMQMIYSNNILFFGLIIAEFLLVIGISAMMNRLSLVTATIMFALYSVINGAVLSFIFVAYSTTIITKTFLITAGMFGAMSFYGYVTKKDLSSIGKILMMALIGLIIATIVNIFLKSSGFDFILSYLGVAIFVGLTAYDTQKIKEILATAEDAGESAQKMALMGALSLYLDFINLFLYLLRIFGNRNS